MQPNDPNHQPQYSSDYLNQIATPAQVKTLNPFVLWGLIGGLLILGIIIVLAVTSGKSGPPSSSLASVAAKLDNLRKVSEDAQQNIQSSELRTINSGLTLSLTNTNRDLTEPLKTQKIKLKDKKNKTVIAVTKDFDDVKKRLEDARLNAVFDRTYAREMTYQLRTLRSDMLVLYKKSRSTSLKATLETTDKNIKPLLEGFQSFNGS